MTTEKIFIGIDDERIEATGQELQDILDYRASKKSHKEAVEAEIEAKAAAKAAAQAKLAALGLTVEDLQALGL